MRTRGRWSSLAGELCRQQGLRIASGSAANFLARLAKVPLSEETRAILQPVVDAMTEVNKQIDAADEVLAALSQRDQEVARLCTVPSVGPVTAVAFVAMVDDPKRFASAHQVEAYTGLVPRERSSGETRAPREDHEDGRRKAAVAAGAGGDLDDEAAEGGDGFRIEKSRSGSEVRESWKDGRESANLALAGSTTVA